MAVASFNDIDIPYVNAENVEYEIAGDFVRTIGNVGRLDSQGAKRTWSLETGPISDSARASLTEELASNVWTSGTFVTTEVSSGVEAYVREFRTERIMFWRDGVFHNDGKQLRITIEEK